MARPSSTGKLPTRPPISPPAIRKPGPGFRTPTASASSSASPPRISNSPTWPATRRCSFTTGGMLADGQLVFLANISPDKSMSGRFIAKGRSAETWDPFTGAAVTVRLPCREGPGVRELRAASRRERPVLSAPGEGSPAAAGSLDRREVTADSPVDVQPAVGQCPDHRLLRPPAGRPPGEGPLFLRRPAKDLRASRTPGQPLGQRRSI